jgi:hypothetical protein
MLNENSWKDYSPSDFLKNMSYSRKTSSQRKKGGFKKLLKSHLRKVASSLVINFLSNKLFFFCLGAINKNFLKGKIATLFMIYPATQKYSRAYVYDWQAQKMKHQPKLVGFFSQKGKWGLIFGVSLTEEEILDGKSSVYLEKIERSFEKFRKIVGAKKKTYAGIIPGIMRKRSISESSSDAESTATAVVAATKKIIGEESLGSIIPVIILGGKGFIGSVVTKKLQSENYPVYPIDYDPKKRERIGKWPRQLKGQPVVILNVTKKGVLKEYIPEIWPNSIVINEVYPEPSWKEISQIKTLGASFYHIVGTEGEAFPSFPRAYKGGIPCCATIFDTKNPENNPGIITNKK